MIFILLYKSYLDIFGLRLADMSQIGPKGSRFEGFVGTIGFGQSDRVIGHVLIHSAIKKIPVFRSGLGCKRRDVLFDDLPLFSNRAFFSVSLLVSDVLQVFDFSLGLRR